MGGEYDGSKSKRRNPPAPLPGTGAALTSVLTKEGPRGSAPRGPSLMKAATGRQPEAARPGTPSRSP